MKKYFLFNIIFLFILFIIPFVSADGSIHIYDQDMWGLFDEGQQFCAINYKNGYQHMILTVNTGEELRGEKAVWIFPVPAKPEEVVIDIVKGFPQLTGYDVVERSDKSISETFMIMRLTQVYTLPFIYIFSSMGALGNKMSDMADMQGITVYEHIEEMGLTTELVSAVDSVSLANYLDSKGLVLTEQSRIIFEEYTGQEYSFVVSWISNVTQYKQEQMFSKTRYSRSYVGNSLGVYIIFPTNKIYYPLKPTSVYGSKIVPAAIYVLDYVEPIAYPEIKSYIESTYFYQEKISVSEELNGFFIGHNIQPSPYYDRNNQNNPKFLVDDVKYTKIKISAPSKYLTQDLWIDVSTPLKIKMADFANRNMLVYGLIFFIISSCLASLLSAMILFKESPTSKIKFALFGLWNFLTLIGFSVAANIVKIDTKFAQLPEEQKSTISFKKILITTLLLSLIIPVIFIFIIRPFRYWDYEDTFGWLIFYFVNIIFIGPLVWGYNKSRKIMRFILLFTIFFLIISYLFQILLTAIF